MRLIRLWWLATQRRGLLGLRTAARRTGRTRPSATHLEVGERGEFEALFFLRTQGYLVTERRWRTPELHGDLDLIAWEEDTLCFVEVKTRTARDFAPAASAVNASKRRMLGRMAHAYRRTLPRNQRDEIPTRFDVVSVYLIAGSAVCELTRGAFDPRDDDFRRRGV